MQTKVIFFQCPNPVLLLSTFILQLPGSIDMGLQHIAIFRYLRQLLFGIVGAASDIVTQAVHLLLFFTQHANVLLQFLYFDSLVLEFLCLAIAVLLVCV